MTNVSLKKITVDDWHECIRLEVKDAILISYKTANQTTRQLYASPGFVEQTISDGTVLARLDLNTAEK